MTNLVGFTAVIPTINRAHLIERAIESVLNQTVPPQEVIVVDDGSQDETEAKVATFGNRVIYRKQANAGSAAARHNGFQAASCDWVALLDSDDVWLPDHLEKMQAAIVATKGQGNYYFADVRQPPEKGGGSIFAYRSFAVEGSFAFREDGTAWAMMRGQPMMLQATVFKRQAYFDCGGFMGRLRYRDDTHLFLKLGIAGPICAVNHIGTQMTADDDPSNRLTLTYDGRKMEEGYRMQVWMFEDLLERFPEADAATRTKLTRRLAGAHRSLSRVAWRSKRPFAALTAAVQSVRLAPAQLNPSKK